MFPLRNILIPCLLLLVMACGRREKGDKPVVTVTLPPYAWFVQEIAGDSVEVNVLLSGGTNPETFEPGMSTIRDASTSDIVFLSGAQGFESDLVEKLAGGNDDLRIVDTSAGITLLYGTHDHAGHSHVHGTPDPHFWTSVKNARVIALNIYNALKDVDPQREAWYTSRFQTLDAHLDSLDRAFTDSLARLRGRSFLVMHPSLGYFARDYGLEQMSMGDEGRENSVKAIRDNIDKAADRDVEVVFVQVDFDGSRARSVATQIGARVVELNLLNSDWESEIKHITDALTSR